MLSSSTLITSFTIFRFITNMLVPQWTLKLRLWEKLFSHSFTELCHSNIKRYGTVKPKDLQKKEDLNSAFIIEKYLSTLDN